MEYLIKKILFDFVKFKLVQAGDCEKTTRVLLGSDFRRSITLSLRRIKYGVNCNMRN